MTNNDSSSVYDIESLKISPKEQRENLLNKNSYRSDVVHAGYRILQCIFSIVIFIYHLIAGNPGNFDLDIWDVLIFTIYPFCFFASFILALIRMMHFIPNPNPVIPVTISVIGWSLMLISGILAMRHANLKLHIEVMTDHEVAMDPIFRHDLILCSLSLVGSSIYLVHAWLCYDCWKWEKKMKNIQTNPEVSSATESSNSESDSGMSSNEDNMEFIDTELPIPSTSDGYVKNNRIKKSLKLFKRLKKISENMKIIKKNSESIDNNDSNTKLEDIFSMNSKLEELKVEDEPVILYCCCLDLVNLIKQEYKTKLPVHEFQVIHIM